MSEKNTFIFGVLKTPQEIYKLTKQRIYIGRNKNSQIILNNSTISKDHAIIEFDEDYIATIKDLNSSNGTFVNGEKLKNTPMRLRSGDKITFGRDETEYVFESFNINNDTKAEPEIKNELDQNNNNISQLTNTKITQDGKIGFTNEKESSNHFQNRYHNNFNNNTNGINDSNNDNFLDNRYKKINSNNSYNQQVNNSNTVNNSQKFNNDSNNNVLINSEITFKNKIDDLEKKISLLETEKNEINESLKQKNSDLKKMTNLFDDLNTEYSKLNDKHNTLLLYLTEIQEKYDASNSELKKLRNTKKYTQNADINRILNEKDSLIFTLQNELNYYKELSEKNTKENLYKTGQIEKKLEELKNIYETENEKLKEKLEFYKNKYNSNIPNKNIQLNNFSYNINFAHYEMQINALIDNLNRKIEEYNSKLAESLNKITEFFDSAKKEEAAKYLIEKINEYMTENQKILAENAKLKAQNIELQSQLNFGNNNYCNNNYNNTFQVKNKNNFDDNEILVKENKNNRGVKELNNKIKELENLIDNLKIGKYNISNNRNNNENNLKETFIKVMNELKDKENTINKLQNELNYITKRKNTNFDDKQIVNTISQTLQQKDNILRNLREQINSDNLLETQKTQLKIEQIRKNRENLINS